ncbi:hypothetical protein [Salinimicrobium flavum]|uniref:Uncharacterized protein n=1 Tax=Salinimicrobium flavum TaxID=1737065 RepID=A0ABW5IYC0_9FLAO
MKKLEYLTTEGRGMHNKKLNNHETIGISNDRREKINIEEQ